MTSPRGPNQNPGYNLSSLTDQSGTLTPTVRMSAGAAGYGQSLKQFTGLLPIVGGATATLETVTVGKTFYITDIAVYSNTAAVFAVTINAGPTAILNAFCKGDTGPIQIAGMETQPSASSGTVVQLVFGSAAGTTVAFNVFGYEQ